jgi:branched-chain amino acid transport system substrate-binding protein
LRKEEKKMRTKSLLLLVVLAAVVALAGCGPGEYECTDEWGCATIEKGQTIKVAYVGPNTGDYSAFGIDMTRGAELAVKAHPQVKGFDIELLSEDTQGTPEQGASVANKLAADPRVVAIDGHSFSGSTEVAIPIYEEAHIVMMAPSATNPDLTKLGSAVFNRVAFHDEMQADFASRYIYDSLGITKIAVMHDGGAYGQGLAEGVAADFEVLGGEVVGVEAITPGETDYSAPLAAIAASGPELIYYGGYDADAAVLVTQMPGAGLEGVILFGCDGTYGANFIDLAGDAAEGSFSTYVPIPESAAFDTFRADYQADYGDEQGKLSPFSPHSYDAASILINAIEAVAIEHGDSLIIPRKALADEVRGTAGYVGLTGQINCSSTGECAAASIQFMKVENGDWVPGPGQ